MHRNFSIFETTHIYIGDFANGNVLTQFLIKCKINTLAMYQRQLLSVAERVDLGSTTQKNLHMRAAKIKENIDKHSCDLFRPFDIQNGFGMHKVAKAVVTGVCFVLAMPVKGAKVALSELVQHRKDVSQESLLCFLR